MARSCFLQHETPTARICTPNLQKENYHICLSKFLKPPNPCVIIISPHLYDRNLGVYPACSTTKHNIILLDVTYIYYISPIASNWFQFYPIRFQCLPHMLVYIYMCLYIYHIYISYLYHIYMIHMYIPYIYIYIIYIYVIYIYNFHIYIHHIISYIYIIYIYISYIYISYIYISYIYIYIISNYNIHHIYIYIISIYNYHIYIYTI